MDYGTDDLDSDDSELMNNRDNIVPHGKNKPLKNYTKPIKNWLSITHRILSNTVIFLNFSISNTKKYIFDQQIAKFVHTHCS